MISATRQSAALKPTTCVSPGRGNRLQRKCACGAHTPGGGECRDCASKRLQRKAASGMSADAIPTSVQQVLRGPGRPLESPTRTMMEAGFGHDFSNVRVHADGRAAESARAVHALAYTVGHDVVFAGGQYSPGTSTGRRLIAHELAHVVQQRHLASEPVGIGDPGSVLEREADGAAERLMSEQPVQRLAASSVPLISREVDTRSMPAKDGGTDQVSRDVTPGKCALGPQSRASTSGDIDAGSAFLQLDLCRGNMEGQLRGELDYGDALKQAGQAVGKLLSGAASGQGTQQALSTFANDLKQLKPGAQVKLNFQASDVFRLDLGGTGNASVAGGASGKATARATFDTGPVNLVIEATASGGSQQKTDYGVTVNIEFGGKGLQAPDCHVCQCSDPKINFSCAHVPPSTPGKPPPGPVAAQPRYIPYFFKYAETTPNAQRLAMNEQGLREAVNLILNGYTVARIEGSASPEGPEQGRRGSFKNNTRLAEARAIEGKKQLDAAIHKTLDSPFLIMRTENLSHALSASYPVIGRAELFGAGPTGEVDDRALLPHLQNVLAPPAEGKPDPLAQEHVTGAGLSTEVQRGDQEDVEAFRSGKRDNRKLGRDERLQAIYEPLRRALIVLDPPAAPPPDLRLSQKAIEKAIGQPVACSDENKALFAHVPVAQPFEGECKAPGKGSSK
jgi:hypothetical protein